MENGSDINAKDRLSRDACDLAVKNERHDVVKLLEIVKKLGVKILKNNTKINFGDYWILLIIRDKIYILNYFYEILNNKIINLEIIK